MILRVKVVDAGDSPMNVGDVIDIQYDSVTQHVNTVTDAQYTWDFKTGEVQ